MDQIARRTQARQPKPARKWKEKLGTLGGCLLMLLFTFGPLAILVALFKRIDLLIYYGYPLAEIVSGIGIFLILPLSLILLIFRKTRGWGGLGIFVSSMALGFATWLWALMLAFVFAGLGWVIGGLLFYGVGVVPIAIIAAAIQGQWGIAIEVTVSIIIVFVLRAVGNAIVERASEPERQPEFDSPPPPPDFRDESIYPNEP